MHRAFYSLAIVLSALMVVSCQKTDVITDERNIEGTWSITGISSDRAYDFNNDGRTETDIYGTYSSCGRDIVVEFEKNGYGQIRQGCNASWQNISWRFSNSNRILNISLPDDELNLDIQQVDNYIIRGTDQVFLNGNSFSIMYTFQRR